MITQLGSTGTVTITNENDNFPIDAGTIFRLFSINIVSGDGGAGVVTFRDSNSATADIWLKETGVISTGKTIEYGVSGIRFNTSYIEADENVVSLTLNFTSEF